MAKDCSFDVVSDVDLQEMDNAINQTKKEIIQRYDFKNSKAGITLNDQEIRLSAEDEYKIGAMLDMLRTKMVKRSVPLKCLQLGKIEPASGGSVRQTITIQKGIHKDKAKEVTNYIKSLKLKVQSQFMEDQVRVSGAKKDDLQNVMQALREKDFGIDLQFINFRS